MKEQQELRTQQMITKYEELMELERNEILITKNETIESINKEKKQIYDENTYQKKTIKTLQKQV